MSNKNFNFNASKEEKDLIQSLISELKQTKENIRLVVSSDVSFVSIVEYENKYEITAKELNALYAKLEISDRIKEEYKSNTARTEKSFAYREKKNEIETIGRKDSISEDSNALSFEAQIQKTPIISRQNKGEIPSLNFEQVKLDDFINKPSAASTPCAVEIGEFRRVNFDTQKEGFKYIKQEITGEISPAYVESFLEDEKDFFDFVETVKRGFQLPYIYQVVRDKIFGFVEGKEEELVNQTRDDTPSLTAIENLPEHIIAENISNNLNMRGLSVKDALDLIP